MYVKKIHQFLSSIKNDADKRILATFFCLTVYIWRQMRYLTVRYLNLTNQSPSVIRRIFKEIEVV